MGRSQTGLAALLVALIAPGCSTMSGGFKPSAEPDAANIVPVDLPDKKVGTPALSKRTYVGNASWYGPGFTGKRTASGHVFDDSKFTAAHKTLPLGSKAKITNLSNGKSVQVEINDRGPFVEGRIIDLSHAAASALGMIDRGIVQVRIDLLMEEGVKSVAVD